MTNNENINNVFNDRNKLMDINLHACPVAEVARGYPKCHCFVLFS